MALRRYLSIGLMVTASVAILAVVVGFVGYERTLAAVRHAGVWAFVAMGALTAAFILVQAGAWAALNRPIGHKIRFRTLFAGTLVGTAGNIVTPTLYVGGEALKVVYVGKVTGLPYPEVAGTVLLAKYLEFLSFILVFSISTIVAAIEFRGVLFEPAYVWGGVSMLAVAGLLLGLCVVLWVSLLRRWHPLTRLVGWLARLGLGRQKLARLRSKTAEMEDQVSRVFCEEGGTAFGVFAALLAGQAAIFTKPLAFFLLGSSLRLGMGDLCLIFVVGQLLLSVQLTPSGVGMFDGGMIGTFALLGLNTADDAAMCMAFLLCYRLWEGLIITIGALLAASVGARILSKAGTPEAAVSLLPDGRPDAAPEPGETRGANP